MTGKKSLRVTLGKNMTSRRNELKMDMNVLAKQTGIAKSQLEEYEAGRSEPNLEHLVLIGDALRISINHLIGNPKTRYDKIMSMTPDQLTDFLEKFNKLEFYDLVCAHSSFVDECNTQLEEKGTGPTKEQCLKCFNEWCFSVGEIDTSI